MGCRTSVMKEDERVERDGCKGAKVRGLRKLECIVGEEHSHVDVSNRHYCTCSIKRSLKTHGAGGGLLCFFC
jgi:hypothetical protein